MNHVPAELLQMIFDELDLQTLFNAWLTCRLWKEKLSPRLPMLHHLHVDMDSMACDGHIQYRDARDMSTVVCQCDRHARQQGELLREVCQRFGDRLSSLLVEDSLLYKTAEEGIHDRSMYVILSECCKKNLKQLEFRDLNLQRVHFWTLLTAGFSELISVHFLNCTLPCSMNESQFARILAMSHLTLESVAVTNNALISDKFTSYIASRCPKLRELNVSGCSEVTTLTPIKFCEELSKRHEDDVRPVELVLSNTNFSPAKLFRHLENPLLTCGPGSWRAQPMTVNIAYDRNVILLVHATRPGLIITVYV